MKETKRALAYIAIVDEIVPIDGYDRVEYARVKGWWVVVSKQNNLSVGDKCVYFEIDSKVPSDDERFSFLESKHYKIKTQKMCRVYSQGLIMPIDQFPELNGLDVGHDVTDMLGVTYNVPEDNYRKRNSNADDMYNKMMSRRSDIFKKKWAKKIMKYNLGRKIMFAVFGNKSDKPLKFPEFVVKTDETRVENKPVVLTYKDKKFVATEKLDGTSCSYSLKKCRNGKREFNVCSRNVCLSEPKDRGADSSSIYWRMEDKYKIEKFLNAYLDENKDLDWVYLQGEGVGSVQGNPLKLKEDDFYAFNLVDSKNGRLPSLDAKWKLSTYQIKFVPILGIVTMPETMEELKLLADGNSSINRNVKREGIVYRSLDGKESFKNVSRKYLIAKGE